MIYLDYGATSFHKPPAVRRAMLQAMSRCASPGRGGYPAAEEAAETVYSCRETAAALFDCRPEQVVLTCNCTHGLNIAIRSLFRPGSRVVVSGFEHNAVVRPLYALGAEVIVAGRRLFDPADTLEQFGKALSAGRMEQCSPMCPMSSAMCCRFGSWRRCASATGFPSFWTRPSPRGPCR